MLPFDPGGKSDAATDRWLQYIAKFEVLLADGRAADAAEFLTELLPLFTGALRRRMETCVLVARVCAAKWRRDPRYPQRLREGLEAIKATEWPEMLGGAPDLLAELCADGIEQGVEPDFCRALMSSRGLVVPGERRTRRAWPVRVYVLGEFHLEVNGARVDVGSNPLKDAVDILRALAVARDHTCTLQQLRDWLWPNSGWRSAAPCEQALRQLEQILGRTDLVHERDGKLRLATDKVWIDLDQWDVRLAGALWGNPDAANTDSEMHRAVAEFPGPLLATEPATPWSAPAAERIRSAYVEVVMRLGHRLEERGELQLAIDAYLRALTVYPNCERCVEALLRARNARDERRELYPPIDALRRRSEAADT